MSKQSRKNIFDVSTYSIAKFFAFILSLVFLYYIRNVVAFVFVVVILVAGFTPFINLLVKNKIPRIISVIILFVIIIGFVSFLVYMVIPPIIEQLWLISSNINNYSERLELFNMNFSGFLFQGKDFLTVLGNMLSEFSGGLLNSVVNIFGSATYAVTVIVLTFYILVQEDSIENFIIAITPKKQIKHAIKIYEKISIKLGKWLRGRIMLSVIIGFVSYLILRLANIQYSLSLAFLAAILDIVPIIGPIIAGLIALFIAYLTGASWWQIVSISAAYMILQQFEAQFLVPKMMGRAVGLSPIIIIIALMIGAEIGGIVGAVLAIPIAAGILVIIQEWPNLKKIR
jgi:predicted PurR-regulated permease PerM